MNKNLFTDDKHATSPQLSLIYKELVEIEIISVMYYMGCNDLRFISVNA